MNCRRIPVLPTLVVLVAVGIMVRLGFWQLDRLHQKEALLARYGEVVAISADIPWPADVEKIQAAMYRYSRIDCRSAKPLSPTAGRNAKNITGYAQQANCVLPDGSIVRVILGWSQAPVQAEWHGGLVSGFIAPGPRLVAQPAVAGLEANAVPDPREIPNNHLSYAVQWFLFAGVALVIYGLAVRKRLAGNAPPR
jgi:surfeit locus 1 family protein